MTKQTEALKLALEALEQLQGGCTDHNDGTVEAITVWCPEVIDAIKEALAQPAQEPEPDALTVVYMSGVFEGRKLEREACAKVVEVIEARCIAKDVDDPPLKHIADEIRSRGNT